ncbi:MAG: hypothetical protein KBD78_04470 [Oligoflexales bacterium]|nr:hypothetical protein [Oligoflexales bacterium]
MFDILKQRRHFFYCACLVFSHFICSGLAQGADPVSKAKASKLTSIKVADSKSEKVTSISINASHFFGMQDDIEPETSVEVDTSFRFSESHRMGLNLSAVKYYDIPKGEEEWLLADPNLNYRYTIISQETWKNSKFGPTLALASGLSIPVSESSRINDIITRLGLSLPIEYKAESQNLFLSLTPRFLYYFNRYKTAPTEIGDDGGQPLRKTNVGVAGLISWQALKFLTFDIFGRYSQIRFESIELANRINNSEILPVQHFYTFDLSLAVKLEEQAKIRFGYTKEDPVEQNGGVKIVAYDELTAKIYAGAELAF